MWLTRRLFPRQGAKVQVGLVEQENGFAVQGEGRYRSPQYPARCQASRSRPKVSLARAFRLPRRRDSS